VGRIRARLAFVLAAPLTLAACGSDGGSAPGAVSEGEAQALQEAAKMLEERRLPEGALPPINAPATEQVPAETPEGTD
jgi:hypothetical protein